MGTSWVSKDAEFIVESKKLTLLGKVVPEKVIKKKDAYENALMEIFFRMKHLEKTQINIIESSNNVEKC
jgi:hypothetical protein